MPEPETEDFGIRVRQERTARKRASRIIGAWTQADVAQRIAALSGQPWGQSDQNKLEKGKRQKTPPPEILAAINEVFRKNLVRGSNVDAEHVRKKFTSLGSATSNQDYANSLQDTTQSVPGGEGSSEKRPRRDGSELSAQRRLQQIAKLGEHILVAIDKLTQQRAHASREYERRFSILTGQISRLAALIAAGQAASPTALESGGRATAKRARRRAPRRSSRSSSGAV